MNIKDNEGKIKELLKQVDRDGIYDLMVFLEKSDFYRAPCSRKYHLCFKGGLAQHSLNVFGLLCDKKRKFNLNLSSETLIICGLLHDICKVDIYKENKDINKKEPYIIEDNFPLGHGEKSVILLQKFIKLTTKEILMIRWHMSAFDLSDYTGKKAYHRALEICPEVLALFTADYEATVFLEGK